MIEFNGRHILLDIEGTTASVAYVHEVMFPFARAHLEEYLDQAWESEDVQQAIASLVSEAGFASVNEWQASEPALSLKKLVIARVNDLMNRDVKSTGLKALQGLVWKQGFVSGKLVAPLYDDVLPALQRWRGEGIDVRIYSSGSIAAQKLFFGHTQFGNLLHLLHGHYDTTIGSKREKESYLRIAKELGCEPSEVLFVTDLEGELEAAQAAGIQVVAALRPGNAPLSDFNKYPTLTTFDEILL